MSQYVYRYLVANVWTLVYSFLTLVVFVLNYVKNPFRSPWAQKLRLVPPTPLSDLKYGTHKYLKVNDIKLHYVESGDPTKPLMIFLHGFPEFWYSWRYQILEFQKDYWCVAVDMRGYGDSERPEEVSAYKLELLIDDIKDLVKQLGREKCILVSHDWGGLVAATIRNVYPEMVSAVIMMASMTAEAWLHEIWSNWRQFLKSWYIFLFRMPVLPEQLLLMNDMVMFDGMVVSGGEAEFTDQDRECYKYWFGKLFALTPPINYYRANFTCVSESKHYTEDIPMLVIHAEKDLYICAGVLEFMKKQYDRIEVIIAKGLSHSLQQEAPETVNKLVRQFLSKNNV